MEEQVVQACGVRPRRRPPSRTVAARLPHPDLARHAGAGIDHRRVDRPRGSVRREGGGRGAAPPQRACDRERDLRRARHSLRPAAVPPAARARAPALRPMRAGTGSAPRADPGAAPASAPSQPRRPSDEALAMLTLPRFEWCQPTSTDAACSHSSPITRAESLMVAGGTDAVPNLKHRLHEPRYVVLIGGVRELSFVRETSRGPRTWAARHARPRSRATRSCARDFPSLAKAAGPGRRAAAPQHGRRSAATSASTPAARTTTRPTSGARRSASASRRTGDRLPRGADRQALRRRALVGRGAGADRARRRGRDRVAGRASYDRRRGVLRRRRHPQQRARAAARW